MYLNNTDISLDHEFIACVKIVLVNFNLHSAGLHKLLESYLLVAAISLNIQYKER